MSVKATIEIVLHIDSLRAIDILSQGLYIIQFQIYSLSNKEKILAFPYNIIPSTRPTEHKVFNGRIIQNIYRSSALFIKYFDEAVELNEICNFHTEIEALPHSNNSDLFCICELLYAPLFLNRSEEIMRAIQENTDFFQVKGRAEMTIFSPLNGVNAFCPILLRDENFFEVHCCFYVMVKEFKYRSSNIEDEISGLIINAKKNNRKNINCEVVGEIIFPGREEVLIQDFLDVYEKYVAKVQTGYENLKQLCLKCTSTLPPQHDLIISMPDFSSRLAKYHKIQQLKPIASPTLPKIEATDIIFSELFDISETFNKFLPTLLQLLQSAGRYFFLHLLKDFNDIINDIWAKNAFHTFRYTDCYSDSYNSDHQSRHKSLSSTLKGFYEKSLSTYPGIIQTNYFPSLEEFPLLFIDSLTKSKERTETKSDEGWIKSIEKVNKGGHIVFLVHGFRGSAMDMRKLRNQLSIINKNLTVVCAYSLESKTDGDIRKMGRRLAKEVTLYVREHYMNNSLQKISFIGYSLGGIIIRAALPLLEDLYEKLGFLITLSSPHLGTLLSSSYLVDAGIWVLSKFKKTLSLIQLSMKDDNDLLNTFMYGLSKSPGLEYFQNIAFVSSLQDKYVPFESTRVEIGPKASKKSKNEPLGEMAFNILKKMQCVNLLRIDANFKFKGASLDRAIGRAAHIGMIDDPILIDMILNTCKLFFE
ncbi:hypothetical protein SteCoe_6636 [Stentor coeruleus]|uniref:DUF676 domain-containing protein n=1 Tax=Stentor coeruleus TaxID=5963 RepID=A0A1R2CPE0_9CILI|nr:hypothetical protein SteCoe_6636 [Stentor coeruleus]